MHKKKSYS